MKLSVALVLSELGKISDAPAVFFNSLREEHAGIFGIRLLNDEDAQNDILYIAEQSDITPGIQLPPHLFIAGAHGAGTVDGAAYFSLPVRDLINRIERIFYKYNQIEAELSAAISRREPLKVVLSICARFFNNPVTISDLRMRFIETSDNVVRDAMPDYFKVVIDTGYIDIRIIQAMKKRGYDVLINNSSETILFELAEIPTRFFSKNIYDGSQIIACLVIHEVFSPLDPAQIILVDQTTQVVDNYAFRSPRGKQTSMTRVEQIIGDLIDGGKYDNDIHSLYLRQINWGVRDGYYLIKIQVSSENFTTSTAEYTFASAHSFFPASLIVEKEDFATIVICCSQIHYDFLAAMDRLEKYLELRHDKAAVSRRFLSFSDICEQYAAVALALRLGETIDPGKHLYKFNTYSLPVMLKLCSNQIDLRVFCMHEALMLHDLDKESGSEFFRSLFVYLKHNRSLSAAANELRVHRNTLLYRLGRVSEMTGIDPSDESILLPMLLSYEILHYRLKIEDTAAKKM